MMKMGGETTQMDQIQEWERVQMKTFLNWANYHLASKGMRINSLEDLTDGIRLISLYECLTDKDLGRFNANPRLPVQKLENINLVINSLKKDGVYIDASAEDVLQGKKTMVLGLFWTMITKLHIQRGKGKSSGRDVILEWVKEYLHGYTYNGVPIQEMDLRKESPECFKDGRIFSYLVHRTEPEYMQDLAALENSDNMTNLENAFTGAEKFGVPRLLDPEDMQQERPDEQSILTYLSAFKDVVEKLGKWHPGQEAAPPAPPPLTAKEAPVVVETIEDLPVEEVIEKQVGTPCPICSDPLEEGETVFLDWMNGDETRIHARCFVCDTCKEPIYDKYYFEDNKFFDPEHYHVRKGWVCGQCNKSVSSGAYKALGKYWHPEHFQCERCQTPLRPGKWFIRDEKVFCNGCEADVVNPQKSD